jgi:hypothetical protein
MKNLKELIGYKLDTNQYTSKIIKSESDAKLYLEKVVTLYGEEIFKYMFLTDDKRFTTFRKDGITLESILN